MRRVAIVGTLALIAILLCGEPIVQSIAAGLLAVGAWPLYRAIEREGLSQMLSVLYREREARSSLSSAPPHTQASEPALADHHEAAPK